MKTPLVFSLVVPLVVAVKPTCKDDYSFIYMEVETNDTELCMLPAGGKVRLTGQHCGNGKILWDELKYVSGRDSKGSCTHIDRTPHGQEKNSSRAQKFLGVSCGLKGDFNGSQVVPTECDLIGECETLNAKCTSNPDRYCTQSGAVKRCVSSAEKKCYDNEDITRSARPDGAECSQGECWTPKDAPLKQCVSQRTAPCANKKKGDFCDTTKICWHDSSLFPSSMPNYCEAEHVVTCLGKQPGADCEYHPAYIVSTLKLPSPPTAYIPEHVSQIGSDGRSLPSGRNWPVLASKCRDGHTGGVGCLGPWLGACYGKSESSKCHYWSQRTKRLKSGASYKTVGLVFERKEGVCKGALEATRQCSDTSITDTKEVPVNEMISASRMQSPFLSAGAVALVFALCRSGTPR
eukprot:TRINITY_DN10327_c0_g1_i3.p1 TRINITY_DN10327_c0_g1~~TRINITY_DN10327_c0_g1_i3.p1  ORF type:complete len:405 (-),score=49.16 TRINITY_DN10327_c0_g1_i3:275-1489(-)